MRRARAWVHAPVVVITLALTGPAGCVVESVCYSDADCPDTHLCDQPPPPAKHGQCRKRCSDASDCLNPDRTCDSRPWISGDVCLRRCANDLACPGGWLCNAVIGGCYEAECRDDDDCAGTFECRDGFCVSREPLRCPDGMVAIEERFCVDIYEASRPDASDAFVGTDGSYATSRPGVLPWVIPDNATAQAACEAAGKILCSESQWQRACTGPDEMIYAYGNDYSPTICNGIDKYCQCDSGPCEGTEPCPYPHCFSTCGVSRGLMTDPSGSNTGCTNGYGVFDMNGNLWEHVLGGDETRIRGGAFNCLDSQRLHRCDYIPGTWTPSARGFRCCSLGITATGDGGAPDGAGDP